MDAALVFFAVSLILLSIAICFYTTVSNRQRNQKTRARLDKLYQDSMARDVKNRQLVSLLIVILEHMKSPMCAWNEKSWFIAEIEKELNIIGGRLQ